MAIASARGPISFFDHGLSFCGARERARLASVGRQARLAVQQEEARLRRLFPPLRAALVVEVWGLNRFYWMLGDIRNHFALATVSGSVFRAALQSKCLNRSAWFALLGSAAMLAPVESSASEDEEGDEEEEEEH